VQLSIEVIEAKLEYAVTFLSKMHGFRDNEVLLQAGYDVIVITLPGGTSNDFS